MTYYLATFHSQTQTYEFARLLSSYGVLSSVIQTPRQAQASCGLSVKIPDRFGLEHARFIISRRQFSSFSAFFEVVDFGGGNKQISRI